MVQSPQIQTVNSPQQQNIQSPIQQPIQQQQQQPQITTSPRSLQQQQASTAAIGNVTQSITSPLPTSSLLSQNLISIENKTIQLQQLNKDIYQLVKLITPPNNNSNNNNSSNINNQTPDIPEYNKNVQLLNSYRIKVQNLIKEIQQDLNNQNLPLFFLSPVLNDEYQQDSLFYDPYYPNQLPPPKVNENEPEAMQLESAATPSSPETLDQHNQRMFLEKFKRQLTPDTITKQSQEWDTVFKDREKLNKNSDRVKLTIFK